MTRNDTFYKILFAIQIALLPLTMAAYLLLPTWSTALFITAIVVAKIWMGLFKDKENHVHTIIETIASALIISLLTIFFTAKGFIDSVVLCVFVVVFIVLMNVLKAFLFKSTMPEMVNAVDACVTLFEYFILIAFAVVVLHMVETTVLIVEVATFAILLTSIVSVAYKLYYVFKTYDVWSKIKTFFANIFKRG